ncbi:DUF416 family protein, partial [Escherichia sp. TWPC-MK]
SGVVHVITHLNCPDIYYTPGGQSAPEPSPLDRRMFGKKMRHVGDRVAAVVAESEEIALEALKLIDVEYEVLKPVMSIDEAMAEDAPVVHDEPVEVSKTSITTVAMLEMTQAGREMSDEELKENPAVEQEWDIQWEIFRLLAECEER